MDQNNNPVTNLSDENTDLAKQYQDILDRYSQELAKTPPQTDESAQPVQDDQVQVTPTESIVEQTQLTTPPETPPISEGINNNSEINSSDTTIPTSEPADIDSTIMEVPPQTLAQVPESQPTESTQVAVEPSPTLPETPVLQPVETPVAASPIVEPPLETPLAAVPPKKNLFKITFIITLIIFLGVASALVYALLNPSTPGTKSTPTPTGTTDITQPVGNTKSCDVNGNLYQVNENFPANDGCNTCTCTEDLTITCTEKACDASSSSKLTPTGNATSSAKISPTKTATSASTKIDLRKADSDTPAAGICAPDTKSTVNVTINSDTASPRCVKVKSTQKLSITNKTEDTITFEINNQNLEIDAGGTKTVDSNFGNYLDKGVHIIKASDSHSFEIWLQ